MKYRILFLGLFTLIIIASCTNDKTSEREKIKLPKLSENADIAQPKAKNIPMLSTEAVVSPEDRVKPEIIKDKNGRVIERRQVSYRRRSGQPSGFNVFFYDYDARGNRILEVSELYDTLGMFNGKVHNTFEYNDDNQKTSFLFQSFDENSRPVKVAYTTYAYNDDGYEIRSKTFNGEGDLMSRVDRFRNDKGEIVKEKFLEYNDKGDIINDDILHYNKKGGVIKEE